MHAAHETPYPLLQVLHVRKEYPGVVALDDFSLDLRAGEIHCVVGENGAGKSTFVKVLAGSITRNSGRIHIDGEEVDILSPGTAKEKGISVIYQDSDSNLIPEFTIAQNIFLGRESTNKLGIIDRKKTKRDAEKVLRGLKLNLDAGAKVTHLSSSEKTLVQIAKEISTRSRIFIIDEPTSSLGDAEKAELFRILESLRKNNIGIIFISHHIPEVFKIADRITIMRDGKLVATKGADDISAAELIKLMVGREISDEPLVHRVHQRKILELRNASSSNGLRQVSFSLNAGEILGIAGLVGSGRSEIARLIYGVDKITSGEIILEGRAVSIRSPREAIENGLAMVPEDRISQGILSEMSVMENITLASLSQMSFCGFKIRKKQIAVAERYTNDLSIKTPTLHQFVKYLSGGNQQKVVLSKYLNTGAHILILDEPTKGVDVAGKSEIHAIIASLAGEGMSIILISSELPELLKICNRLIVMRNGALAGEIMSEHATQVEIMRMMAGVGN